MTYFLLPLFLSLLKYLAFFKLSNLSKLAQNSSLSKKFQLCINNQKIAVSCLRSNLSKPQCILGCLFVFFLLRFLLTESQIKDTCPKLEEYMKMRNRIERNQFDRSSFLSVVKISTTNKIKYMGSHSRWSYLFKIVSGKQYLDLGREFSKKWRKVVLKHQLDSVSIIIRSEVKGAILGLCIKIVRFKQFFQQCNISSALLLTLAFRCIVVYCFTQASTF